MFRPGDKIEYLVDVTDPPNQRGIRGQVKIIDHEIPLWSAKFLLNGGKIRMFNPASPLAVEDELAKKKNGAKVSTDVTTETKPERRTKPHARERRKKIHSEGNQKGDT